MVLEGALKLELLARRVPFQQPQGPFCKEDRAKIWAEALEMVLAAARVGSVVVVAATMELTFTAVAADLVSYLDVLSLPILASVSQILIGMDALVWVLAEPAVVLMPSLSFPNPPPL